TDSPDRRLEEDDLSPPADPPHRQGLVHEGSLDPGASRYVKRNPPTYVAGRKAIAGLPVTPARRGRPTWHRLRQPGQQPGRGRGSLLRVVGSGADRNHRETGPARRRDRWPGPNRRQLHDLEAPAADRRLRRFSLIQGRFYVVQPGSGADSG